MSNVITFRISGLPRSDRLLVYDITMTRNESGIHPRTNSNSANRAFVTIEPDYVSVRLDAGTAMFSTELSGVSLDVVNGDSGQLRLEIRTSGGRIASSIPLSSAGADALAEGLNIAMDTEGGPCHE